MKPDLIYCRRVPAPLGAAHGFCLIPTDDRSAELLGKVPLGEDVAVQLHRDRSLPHHRLFWAVLSHVAQSSQFETAERLLVAIKIRLGMFDLCKLPNGKSVPVPQSINFASMDQTAFADFFDKALRVICDEVLGGYDSARLIEETQAAMGLPRTVGG